MTEGNSRTAGKAVFRINARYQPCRPDKSAKCSVWRAVFISVSQFSHSFLVSLLRVPSCFLRALRVERVFAVAFVFAVSACFAAEYPSKAIRIVVPYPPGGFNDALARTLAERLHASWGQTVIVDNRPGGGTTVGANMVARAPADGHTLL
ncbi:MAG: tripartite tricarboxylate transporter substrate-binding protein, partial [Burkholderiales bacterium]